MALELNGTTGVSAVQAGAVESGDLPAGSVIQVVHNKVSSPFATSSTSFVDTNLSLSITPNKTTSKIYVFMAPSLTYLGTSVDTIRTELRVRNVTSGTSFQSSVQRMDADRSPSTTVILLNSNISLTALDSPSSTLEQTYTLGIKLINGSSTRLNDDGGESTITLMEIAA